MQEGKKPGKNAEETQGEYSLSSDDLSGDGHYLFSSSPVFLSSWLPALHWHLLLLSCLYEPFAFK